MFAYCARERHYIGHVKRPPKKLIVLPKIDYGYRPYVVNGERYYPLPDSKGFVQFGKASWYGKKFHGRRTSSGEIFDMYKKSAAHKTLPLGTYIQVLNLNNKKQIIVRINDRGPFVKGRVVDLSYAAAKEIGLAAPGTAEVKIVALAKEVKELKSPLGIRPVVETFDLNAGEFTVQVGAFRNRDNALRLVDRLRVIFGDVNVSVYDDREKGVLYRVHVTKLKTLTKAGEIEKQLEKMGFEGAFIVSL